MTWLGNLLPWFLGKRVVNQLAASNQFLIGGEYLPAIRAENAFYVVNLPTRAHGLAWFLQSLTYLLPTGLVLRHRSHFDFTVPSGYSLLSDPTSFPVWQIDLSTAIIECWTPVRAQEYRIESAARRKVQAAQQERERIALRIENAMRMSAAKLLADSERSRARRAASALKS